MKKIIIILLLGAMLTGCARQAAPDVSDGTMPSMDEHPFSMPATDLTDGTSAPAAIETEPTTESPTETESTTTEATTTVTTTTPATTTEATTTTVTTTTVTTTTVTTTTAATTTTPVTTESVEVKNLMASVKAAEKCPSSAYDKRSGTKYPTYTHKTYHSNTTGLDRGVNILLPINYDSSKKYPVLYMLHGIFGNEYTLLNDTNMRITEIYTNLLSDGLAKEMIIVFPNMYASSDPNQQPSFDPESVLPYDNFINDLVNDLMPYIEKNYSVLTGRENTAIAGFSMGGREALFIGLQRPDLFEYCGAISPAPGLTPGQDWAMKHPGQLKESELTFAGKDYEPSLLMICCGTNDTTVGTFPESYHKIFDKNKVEHIWYQIPGADHEGAVSTGFYNFVRYIF